MLPASTTATKYLSCLNCTPTHLAMRQDYHRRPGKRAYEVPTSLPSIRSASARTGRARRSGRRELEALAIFIAYFVCGNFLAIQLPCRIPTGQLDNLSKLRITVVISREKTGATRIAPVRVSLRRVVHSMMDGTDGA